MTFDKGAQKFRKFFHKPEIQKKKYEKTSKVKTLLDIIMTYYSKKQLNYHGINYSNTYKMILKKRFNIEIHHSFIHSLMQMIKSSSHMIYNSFTQSCLVTTIKYIGRIGAYFQVGFYNAFNKNYKY